MRFEPIPREQWTEEQRAVAEAIVSGPRGELRGPFVPLLHAPALAEKVQELGEVIRFKTGIADNLLEIAVLLTARHHNCANIWESHDRLARKACVGSEIIKAIAQYHRPQTMNAEESLVYDYARELIADNKISDAVFAGVTQRWGRKGVMELAAICGYYGMLAAVLNAAERPLEPGSVPFGA
jgi:4-carboxymuconolactone decarboxylase